MSDGPVVGDLDGKAVVFLGNDLAGGPQVLVRVGEDVRWIPKVQWEALPAWKGKVPIFWDHSGNEDA